VTEKHQTNAGQRWPPSGVGRRSLLVSDLDGTLLRPDGTLSVRTIEVVNRYIAKGGLFTYATARSFTTAAHVTSPLALTLPVITYAGAVTVDPRSGEALPARLLGPSVVEEVLRRTQGSGEVEPIFFLMHGGRDRVCWRDDRRTEGIASFLAARPGDPRLMPVRDWSALDRSAVFSVALIAPPAALDPLAAPGIFDCHVVYSQDIYAEGLWWLELTSREGTKAAALTRLKAEVDADELVCFGDGPNDLSMFAMADVSLAVGNAVPEVRAAATEVIGANTEDGVAEWIAGRSAPGGPGPGCLSG
jgi:HAD superfamily hydrolase (TIGR01484 family)